MSLSYLKSFCSLDPIFLVNHNGTSLYIIMWFLFILAYAADSYTREYHMRKTEQGEEKNYGSRADTPSDLIY